MAAGVLLVDAVSSVLLGITSIKTENEELAIQVNLIVGYLHVLVFLGEPCLLFSGRKALIMTFLNISEQREFDACRADESMLCAACHVKILRYSFG